MFRTSEYLPAEQLVHTVEPVASPNVPRGQGEQSLSFSPTVAEKVPAGQSVQELAPDAEYLPF